MALTKQNIPVQFDKGVNTKVADQLLVGEFELLENCVRRKYGRIDKRTGYSALGTDVIGSTLGISDVKKLDSYYDQLLAFTDTNLYVYSELSDNWIDRGSIPSVTSTSFPITRNSALQYEPQVAYNQGIAAYFYVDSRGGVRLSVYQNEDNSPLLVDTLVDAAGDMPRAIALGQYIYLLYRSSANLVVKRIAVTSPTTVESVSSALVNDMSTVDTAMWDIDVVDQESSAVFCYPTTTAVKYGYFLADGTIGSLTSGYPNTSTISEVGNGLMTIKYDTDRSCFWMLYWEANVDVGTEPLRLARVSANFAVEDINTIASSDFASNHFSTGTLGIDTDGNCEVFISYIRTTGFRESTNRAVYSYDGTSSFVEVEAFAEFATGTALASKVYRVDDENFVWMHYASELQSTVFLVRSSDGFVFAREFAGLAGGASDPTLSTASTPYAFLLSNVVDADGEYLWATTVYGKVVLESGMPAPIWQGISKLEVDHTPSALRGATIGNTYHLTGSLATLYDGDSVVEDGFNVYPEITSVTAGTTGSLDDGNTYYVAAVFEWVDAKGQRHQSAPSVVESIALTAGQDSIIVEGWYLGITNKVSPRAPVNIVIYRGVAGDDRILYRDETIENVITSTEFSVTLTQSDANLANNEILYTTGGILENLPAPPSTVSTVWKNRLWLAGLEDYNQLAYSKVYTPGEAIAFNDGQRIQCDPAGFQITALGVLDDKLIVFKKDRIFALVGDGPLDTGAQNDYQSPQLVTTDVGCDNPESIVLVPNGLMFKSDKGIRMLDRTLAVLPIGQEVDDYNDLTVTSAQLLANTEEVRFTTLEGTALIYNYRFNQWSTFTNYDAVSAVRIRTEYYHAKPSGSVMKDNDGYLDAGARIRMAIETSWFAFNGLQGYQRVYRYNVLGDFLSDHYTKVKLAYDYEPAYRETVYFNVDEGLDLSYYGEDALYGDSSVYGGGSTGQSSAVYQFSSKPRQQKCEAIKLRFEDIDTKTAGGGASFSLVSLTFEVGLKSTTNRMSDNRQVGSN